MRNFPLHRAGNEGKGDILFLEREFFLFRTGANVNAAQVPRDATPVFFLGKENGGCALAARRRHKGAQCAKNSRFPVRGRKENTMYEYFYVKIKPTAGFFSLTLDPEYRNIIDHAAEEGWRYVGFLPVSQNAYGAILEYDLIFEQEKK